MRKCFVISTGQQPPYRLLQSSFAHLDDNKFHAVLVKGAAVKCLVLAPVRVNGMCCYAT